MDDELDFPSIPGFEELDSAVQCGICHEIIKTPMIISSCSHTFCSLCIRKWLVTKQVCPACSETAYESSLKRNPMVENIVSAIGNLKKKLQKRSPLLSPTSSSTVKRPPPQSQSKSKSEKAKNVSHENNHDSDSDDFIPKKTPPVTPRVTAKLAVSTSSSPSITPQRNMKEKLSIKSLSSPPLKTPQRNMGQKLSAAPLSSPVSAATSSAAIRSPVPAGINVACPVCSQLMPENKVNAHLDRCLAEDSTSGSSSNQISGPNNPSSNYSNDKNKTVLPCSPSISQAVSKTGNKSTEGAGLEPIKKMVYNLFKDAQLKKELKKYSLSTAGDRPALLSRLTRYVAMHNAECDATHPRPLEELRKAFAAEDRSIIAPSNNTFSKLFTTKQPNPEDFNKHRKDYIKQNKSSFDSLVEQARRNKQPKKESKSVSNGHEIASTSSTSNPTSRVNVSCIDSISSSEEENFIQNKEINKKPVYQELSSSDEDDDVSTHLSKKSKPKEVVKTQKNIPDPVVIDSSDSEVNYSPLGKDSPVKKHSDSESDDLSPDVHRSPLNSPKKSINIKRKCIESESDEDVEKSGRPEKRASLERKSPILMRKTPVRRELRSRATQGSRASQGSTASQGRKVPIQPELPTRRSQRKKTPEVKPSLKPPSPDLFGTPPSSGEIPCGQPKPSKSKLDESDDDDDALSQLVTLIDNGDNDSGSTTDFED